MKLLLLAFLLFAIEMSSQGFSKKDLNNSIREEQNFMTALSYQKKSNMSTEGFSSFYGIESSKMNFSEKLKKIKIEFIEYYQFEEEQQKKGLFSKGINLRTPKFYKHIKEFKNNLSFGIINFNLIYFNNNFQLKN